MYDFYNIETAEPSIEEPKGYPFQEELLKGAYEGTISPFFLPFSLFLYTFNKLEGQTIKAFGAADEFPKGSIRRKQALLFEKNLSLFSGAKTFQEVLLLSQNVFDDAGKKVAFNDFLQIGRSIDDQYNKTWLFVEQQAAFRQANGAESWNRVQEDKEILPLLQYQTIGDSRVRPEHVDQDNKTYPLDHPFWDTWFPPNGWNCRCTVNQLRKGKISTGSFEENPDPIFNGNVGKTGIIFNSEHPYFDIPSKFNKAKKNNFGFGTD
jgi:SPP1 gp7 family putative phage head morphogenesis protein